MSELTALLYGCYYCYCMRQLLTYFTEAGRILLAFGLEIVKVVTSIGALLYLSVSASSTVAKAKTELERQKQKARDLDYVLQTVMVELKLFAHKNQGLV